MKNTRKKYTADFKTKVELEALKEQQTVSELSLKYGVHPTQIQTWKRHFLANAPAPFQESKQEDDTEAKLSKLYEQIGKLQVENEFLKKRL
jgi:transposase-like protein